MPRNAVAKLNMTATTMIVTHTSIASLFRSTALMLLTTAVTASTSLCISIGSEKALAANVIAANTAPTALPTPK